MIYQDPYTKEKPEGEATIRQVLSEDEDGALTEYRVKCRFENGDLAERRIILET